MDTPLLQDVVIIFGLSIAVLLLGFRLRVPPIVGFFLTGLLAGPHGWGLIRDAQYVDILAEIGVILLLFTIGIEFSFAHLLEARKTVFVGGAIQLFATALAVFAILRMWGRAPGEAAFMGFLVAMSSTAVTIKLLQERAEVESPHGRAILGIAIFQDVCSVPLMLLVPLLASAGAAAGPDDGNGTRATMLLLLQALAILALSLFAARWVVPWILFQVARTRSGELFLMCVAAIGLGVAWLTSHLGLSLALGAFLAGLIISESEYSHQALGNILPLRDVFASFFFISVGMLINPHYLAAHAALVLGATLSVIAIKTLLAGLAALALGLPLRVALITGLALSQVGEFSFIISTVGREHGLLSEEFDQLFLAVSVISMGATPFLVGLAPRLADALARMPLPRAMQAGLLARSEAPRPKIQNHLIIVGFGLVGRTLARAAQVGGVEHVIIEMNPETVRAERAQGVPIFFGDAGREAILRHAGVREARVLVVAISDAVATRAAVAMARKLSPRLHIIARTRFLREVQPLVALGANDVIPEEFETSVEIFTRVLRKYLVPVGEIDRLVADVRQGRYEILRSGPRPASQLSDLRIPLPEHEILSREVAPGCTAAGQTLAELNLRHRHRVTVLAIRRGAETRPNPGGEARLEAHDVAILFGLPADLAALAGLFADDKPRMENFQQ